MTAKNMEDLVSLCKRRGFIFPSNDVYGGMKGLYDFGPMGVELKMNLKNSWWKSIVYESCLLYTSPSPRDRQKSRMPSSA